MWLLQASPHRTPQDNFFLGSSTAFVAGLVNVCSVMIFFAFSTNVTGHVATFAEEVVKGHWYQVLVLFAWMFTFFLGAMLANLSVTALGARSRYVGHSAPLLLQALTLACVAYYGQAHYDETLWETELLVGCLLFTMGLQNSLVSSISGNVVRTTHLTGLFTDLAMEISMIMQPRFRDDRNLRFKLLLHLAILFGYLLGGVLGGALCQLLSFRALYLGSLLLMMILARDVSALWQRSRARVSRLRVRRSSFTT